MGPTGALSAWKTTTAAIAIMKLALTLARPEITTSWFSANAKSVPNRTSGSSAGRPERAATTPAAMAPAVVATQIASTATTRWDLTELLRGGGGKAPVSRYLQPDPAPPASSTAASAEAIAAIRT